ncbi:MAG: hypothetical protein SFW66_00505 [Gammaproteobacteria bacterium]|nr:hypothetical protein [Gammaproteobacteria bacterium]
MSFPRATSAASPIARRAITNFNFSQLLANAYTFNPAQPNLNESHGTFVYRGVSAGKEEHRKAYTDPTVVHEQGFTSLGTNRNVFNHLTHISHHDEVDEEKTMYVSFTENLGIAREFATSIEGSRVYASHPPEIYIPVHSLQFNHDDMMRFGQTTFDDSGELWVRSKQLNESEVAAVELTPTSIIGSRATGPLGTWRGEFEPNPNYKPNNFSIMILSAEEKEAEDLAKLNPAPSGYRHITLGEAEQLLLVLQAASAKYSDDDKLNSRFHYYLDYVPENIDFETIKSLVVMTYHECFQKQLQERTYFSVASPAVIARKNSQSNDDTVPIVEDDDSENVPLLTLPKLSQHRNSFQMEDGRKKATEQSPSEQKNKGSCVLL